MCVRVSRVYGSRVAAGTVLLLLQMRVLMSHTATQPIEIYKSLFEAGSSASASLSWIGIQVRVCVHVQV